MSDGPVIIVRTNVEPYAQIVCWRENGKRKQKSFLISEYGEYGEYDANRLAVEFAIKIRQRK